MVIVCFDFTDFAESFENVFCYDLQDNLIWQIAKKFDVSKRNPYSAVNVRSNGMVGLYNVEGWVVVIDPATGEEVGREFTT